MKAEEGSIRKSSLEWVRLCFLVLAMAGFSLLVSAGCDDAGTSGASCQCSEEGECQEGFYCDGCFCHPECTGPEDCSGNTPNCDPETGRCVGPCAGPEDCPDPELPNCGEDGVCVALCETHADCTLESHPNCQLDPGLSDHGVCMEPCASHADCESPLYPNCHSGRGVCEPPCTGDEDCPEEAWKCDTEAGLCITPECTVDSECDPPVTVCEEWRCVDGCETHADCEPHERCDLMTPGHMNHCEPRDCMSDTDCDPPSTVCDTDGLADPDGGGYCEEGCVTYLDCGQAGYDCDTVSATCFAKDYGDIGQDCAQGCASEFCLSGMGDVCTAFCCTQHDCPPGWGCRPYDDGTGGDHEVRVCVPLEPTQGSGRPGDTCSEPTDCRSSICYGTVCRETCCTHEECGEPLFSSQDCRLHSGTTACIPASPDGNDPVGALGCATTGGPGDCRSDMCFTYYTPDTGCAVDGDCSDSRPTCWDYPNAGTAGVNDCVKDMCVGHCCDAADCGDYGGDVFFCGKWLYGTGDYNICLLHEGDATGLLGDACSSNQECRSNFCSAAGVCRKRCCTDEDCQDPSYPRCGLEEHTVHNVTRWLNVCLP